MDNSDIADIYFFDLVDILRTFKKNTIDQEQYVNAINSLDILCKGNTKLKLVCLEYKKCFECKSDIIFQENQHVKIHCNHLFHKKCLSNQVMQKCPYLDFENAFIECKYCHQMLSVDEIKQAVPTDWINKREKVIFEDEKNNFDNEVRDQLRNEAKNFQIKCPICMDQVNLNDAGISLACGCKFCSDCLRDYAISKIRNGEFKESQMICPSQCKKEGGILDPFILKYLLSGENSVLFDRLLDFRSKDYDLDPNVKLIKCPGYLLRRQGQAKDDESFTLMTQELIEQFRMQTKFVIPQGYTMHECKNIWEFDQSSNLKQTKCGLCRYEFCLFGCQKTHYNTCQQFQQWISENNMGDQEFLKMVQREKMIQCPKCKMYILKSTGCNHMTCRTPGCNKEFCYVCGGDHPCHRSH